MQAFPHQAAHQLVPCRVKLNFVAPAAEPIEQLQDRSVAVRRIAQGEHLCGAEPLAEGSDALVVGGGPFTGKGIHQGGIAREQVVVDEVGRLVRYFTCWSRHDERLAILGWSIHGAFSVATVAQMAVTRVRSMLATKVRP